MTGRCSQHQHFSAAVDVLLGKITLISLPLLSERPAQMPRKIPTRQEPLPILAQVTLLTRIYGIAEKDVNFQTRETATDKETSSLLIVIVDTNPVWWIKKRAVNDQLRLTHCIDSVMVLGNSHLMLAHRNKLAIIAAHTDHSVFLYPRLPSEKANTLKLPDDGQYNAFRQVEGQVRFQLTQLIAKDKEKMEESFEMEEQLPPNDSLIAGAMCMALCYAHRMEKECPIGESLSVRILIVKGSEDCPSQYMNFMNAVFTAQKQNIVIDACILDTESGLLQQACDITGGLYLKVPQPQGLLEYLMWVFLPDPVARSKMALPPRAQVDYRAACFCHRHLIDIGYVCSVCLSIYCTFSPICSTCQTTFKILGPQKITKKKKKS